MSVVNQQGEGDGRTLHLQHHKGQGHGLHLARQLHTQHQAGLYRDTVLHCQNGTISVNRLLIGLMYKQVASTDIFSLPDKVDLILPDNTTEEVGDDLAKLLCVDIENNDEKELNDTDEDNSKNDSFDGQYGSDLVKTEITECSPDINVKLEVKEYEGVHVGDLNNHKTVHSDVRNMACEHCDRSFKSDLYLKRHIKLMHTSNPGEFKCEICDKLFKTKDTISRHKKKIHGDPIYYVCSFCGKNFKSASHRKDHEEIHRGEADAECGLCGAQVRKKNLERHMKTHSDDAEFQCDICAKPLKTVEALRAHMNSHDLPFKCEYCEKAFSTKYSMKSHTVQQHLLKRESDNSKSKIDKPMTKCDQCDYQCATSKYMKTHKAVKHEGFFHKCQDCKFTTGDLGSLRSHRRAKHEGVVYSCDQCEFKSGYKNNLKNHKAVAHFSVDGRNVFLNPQPDLPKPPQDGLDEQGEDCSKIPKTSWMERP
eukprot:GFUD01026411.1.p1 GENE.GFUD01026411.1~~GFUD01026411.1.p1  ORF type:complete len:479 (+),score=93.72 GFUD01026411.1:36-1472(+)